MEFYSNSNENIYYVNFWAIPWDCNFPLGFLSKVRQKNNVVNKVQETKIKIKNNHQFFFIFVSEMADLGDVWFSS